MEARLERECKLRRVSRQFERARATFGRGSRDTYCITRARNEISLLIHESAAYRVFITNDAFIMTDTWISIVRGGEKLFREFFIRNPKSENDCERKFRRGRISVANVPITF